MVILLDFHAGNLQWFSLHNYSGILTGWQQMVMSWQMDCLIDQQMNPLMYRQKGVFPGIAYLGIFIQEYS